MLMHALDSLAKHGQIMLQGRRFELEYLKPEYVILVTLFESVNASNNCFTYFVNELSFELLVHIILHKDQNKIMMMNSM